jgi:group II intron reverse transcriptase/maturase
LSARPSVDQLLSRVQRSGRRGRPLDEVFPLPLRRELLLAAYIRVAGSPGALTPGTDRETADGMSLARVDELIARLLDDRYVPAPVRRVVVPKASGSSRLIGIPSWSDRLVHEAIRLILSAYYESQLSDLSHGFRPGRGPVSALAAIRDGWPAPDWFVETDVASCFDSLAHPVLLATLSDRIRDRRFLALLRTILQAGCLQGSTWTRTEAGAAQGSPLSPLLTNIYLDRLDRYVERELLPTLRRGLPGRRRSRIGYVRYADDLLLGVAGPRAEAQEVLHRLEAFLEGPLDLKLAAAKTAITDARCSAARFLGHELRTRVEGGGRRSGVELLMPPDVLAHRCACYRANGRPVVRPDRVGATPAQIIARFKADLASFAAKYCLASNLVEIRRLEQAMEASLAATLAARLGISSSEVGRHYDIALPAPLGPRTRTVPQAPAPLLPRQGRQLIDRLLGQSCELCGASAAVEAHHVPTKTVARGDDLHRSGPQGARVLVVCRTCHDRLHAGRTVLHAERRRIPEVRKRSGTTARGRR